MGDGVIGSPPAFGAVQSRFESESPSQGRPRWPPGSRRRAGRTALGSVRQVRPAVDTRGACRDGRPPDRGRRARRGRGHPDALGPPQGAARDRRAHARRPRAGRGRARSARTPRWSWSAPAARRSPPTSAEIAPGRGAGRAGRAARHRARRPGRAGGRAGRSTGTVAAAARRHPAAAHRDAAPAGRGAPEQRRRRDPAHRRRCPTRPGTAGCCAGPTARSPRIVEHRDATEEQRAVDEINTSVYAFESGPLRDALTRLSTENAQGEEYLTDVVGLFAARRAAPSARWSPTGGRDRRRQRPGAARRGAPGATTTGCWTDWMRAGVTVVDPATTWVDAEVELAPDVTLHPGTQLHGRTRVARGAEVGPDCTLIDTAVGERRPGDPGALRLGAEVGAGRGGRPVRLPAAGRGARPGQQGRDVRRGQGQRDRPGRQGAAPVVRRRRHDRRRHQHRRRQPSWPTTTGWPSTAP